VLSGGLGREAGGCGRFGFAETTLLQRESVRVQPLLMAERTSHAERIICQRQAPRGTLSLLSFGAGNQPVEALQFLTDPNSAICEVGAGRGTRSGSLASHGLSVSASSAFLEETLFWQADDRQHPVVTPNLAVPHCRGHG
jgi:hypothetical protein